MTGGTSKATLAGSNLPPCASLLDLEKKPQNVFVMVTPATVNAARNSSDAEIIALSLKSGF
jgi:hypothetical protein